VRAASARDIAVRRHPCVAMSSSPQQRSTAGFSSYETIPGNYNKSRGYTQPHGHA